MPRWVNNSPWQIPSSKLSRANSELVYFKLEKRELIFQLETKTQLISTVFDKPNFKFY